MRTTTFLFLSLLVSAVAANPLLSADDAAPVLDIEGNELQTGTDYYILPAFFGLGGGLTLARSRNGTICPLDVVQKQLEIDKGLPLTFSPVSLEEVVRESTDLNVKFSAAATICVQSTVWRLDSDESTGQFFVTTGGVEGNPGRESLSNWFNIQKYYAGYKLVFCPTVCDFCRPVCGNLGIHFDESGTRRLVLTDAPFIVVFMKA